MSRMRFFKKNRRSSGASGSQSVSQMQQDNMLSTLSVGLLAVDASGKIRRINTQALSDLKLDRYEVSGREMQEFFGIFHDGRNILSELMERIVSGEQSIELPVNTYVRKLGSEDKFYVKGQFIGEYDGRRLIRIFFLFRNIEEELTREYVLEMALTDAKIFPWFFDIEQNKMIIDARWFTHLGIPVGDCTLTADEFAARVHPEERDGLIEALMSQIAGKLNTDLFTYRLQRADGTWEWFQEKSVYLGRTEGAPYRIVGVCQSIQNHKIVEQNLIAARDRAQESDRLKSAFLTNISHEIRTPLNAIVGFSNLLTHGDIAIDSSEGQEFVSLINTNSNQLLALISDVLDLSKIESGTMEYNFAECGLGRLLSDIYHNYLLDMRPDVRFDLMLPDEDMKNTTDAVRLRQVLDHLLSNAAKFTFAGHIGLGYAIAADVRTVELFVEDTGCGIPEDKQRDIFKRFFKVDSFVQGAGLGLPICRTITERLGGTVSFVSRFGEGSRFAVTLPLDGES